MKEEAKRAIVHPDENLMRLCLREAKKAASLGEYPIAALVVIKDQVLSLKHTSLMGSNDPTAHAEILAIRESARILGSRYIQGGTMYTTCEPCPMCSSAAVFARMEGIVFSINQQDAMAVFNQGGDRPFSWRQIDIKADYILQRGFPKLSIHAEFLRDEGLELLRLV